MDLEKAKAMLDEGNTVCICRGDTVISAAGRGIAPVISIIDTGADFKDASAADTIVGKAAALLFAGCGIKAVYGRVMSQSALEVLKKNGIYAEYSVLTEKIINRKGDGICPMEAAVSDVSDSAEAYRAIVETLKKLRS